MTFWFDNYKMLFINDNYLNFIPTSDMTRDEQLNAITRLAIYCIILLYLFDKESEYY